LELPVYLKEHRSLVYRSDVYYLSKVFTEIPTNILFTLIHCTVIYHLVIFGSTYQHFFEFTFGLMLSAQAAFSLGHVFSVIGNDINASLSLAIPVLATQFLFSGFFMDRTKHIPQWLSSLRYLSVVNYSFELMMINLWAPVAKLKCEYDLELLCLDSGQDVLDDFSFKAVNKVFLLRGLKK
jgi:ABC-type multidrug transport system permease subunit